MEPLMGSIIMFAGGFAPEGWAFCQGQILSITQNTALFTILGTTYGGNGTVTFALPDLRGRVAVGTGQGTGLSSIQQGTQYGNEMATLQIANLPVHAHTASSVLGLKASDSLAGSVTPIDGNAIGVARDINTDPVSIYSTGTPNVNLHPGSGSVTTTVQPSGSNQPFSIRNPCLGMNYIIALVGTYPTRPS